MNRTMEAWLKARTDGTLPAAAMATVSSQRTVIADLVQPFQSRHLAWFADNPIVVSYMMTTVDSSWLLGSIRRRTRGAM